MNRKIYLLYKTCTGTMVPYRRSIRAGGVGDGAGEINQFMLKQQAREASCPPGKLLRLAGDSFDSTRHQRKERNLQQPSGTRNKITPTAVARGREGRIAFTHSILYVVIRH